MVILPLNCAPAGTAQDALGPHHCQGHCSSQSLPTRAPEGFACRTLSSQALPAWITAKETSFPGWTLCTAPSWSASLSDRLEREVVKNYSQIKSEDYINIRILLYFSLIMKRRVSFKVFLIIHNAKHKYRKSKGRLLCLFAFPEQLSIYVCFSLELKEVLLIFCFYSNILLAFLDCAFLICHMPVRGFFCSAVLNCLDLWQFLQLHPDGLLHLGFY